MFMTSTRVPKKIYMLEIVFLAQKVGVLKVTTDSKWPQAKCTQVAVQYGVQGYDFLQKKTSK